MNKVRWTGHPFVDAGLATIAAIAKVKQLEELTPQHLQRAVEELQRVLLSDQALGIGVGQAFSGPKKTLRLVFPNSELDNPSNWRGENLEEKLENARKKFQDGVRNDLNNALRCLESDRGDETCWVCGELRPKETLSEARKDKVPLLIGIVNFYPAFAYGIRICGLCALAVRFLPMTLLRTGVSNRLWFLHTHALPVAMKIAEQYGWRHFNDLIARNEPLDFFSHWETAGDAGTVLYLLCELLERFFHELLQVYKHPLPTTAYVFSNDLRDTYINAIPIPSELLIFFARLQVLSQSAFRRFWRELLQVPEGLQGQELKARINFVQLVAYRLLNMESILVACLDHHTPQLLGGWIGHRMYLQEVRKVPKSKLAVLERLGLAIAQADDAKKRIMELRSADRGSLYSILLRYVREGWLKHDEFYALLPPNEDASVSEVRDILLAVIYEWQNCQERGEEFPQLKETVELTPDETLTRIQSIGGRLMNQLPNLSRWMGQLQTARTSDRIRGVYLSAIQRGALSFNDFIFLAPLGDHQKLRLLRDYLLAFLFDRARQVLDEEVLQEEIAAIEEAVEISNGGEA